MGDVAKNFDKSDFQCHCVVCREDPARPASKPEVISAVQDVRDLLGKPLIITRGVSCAAHNAAIGGSRDSRHLPHHADAVDLASHSSEEAYRIMRALILLGQFTLIEVCGRHIHADMRPGEKRLIIGQSK